MYWAFVLSVPVKIYFCFYSASLIQANMLPLTSWLMFNLSIKPTENIISLYILTRMKYSLGVIRVKHCFIVFFSMTTRVFESSATRTARSTYCVTRWRTETPSKTSKNSGPLKPKAI